MRQNNFYSQCIKKYPVKFQRTYITLHRQVDNIFSTPFFKYIFRQYFFNTMNFKSGVFSGLLLIDAVYKNVDTKLTYQLVFYKRISHFAFNQFWSQNCISFFSPLKFREWNKWPGFYVTYGMFRLNSGIFTIFELSELNFVLNSPDCRAWKIISNDT